MLISCYLHLFRATTRNETKMGATNHKMTIGEICQQLETKPDAMRAQWKRAGLTDFAQRREATPEEVQAIMAHYAAISHRRPKQEGAESAQKIVVVSRPKPLTIAPASTSLQAPQGEAPGDQQNGSEGGWKWQAWVFLTLLAVPTIASMGNMYAVTYQITGSVLKSALLTVMLSFTALGFVAAGVRSWYSILLAVLLIVYETFCNTTAIYDGLMGGIKANPTRFLGVVTDIFSAGSYGAALTIGTVIGILIAAVQLASLYELKKLVQ